MNEEQSWNVEQERDKFMDGQDAEYDGNSLMELITDYWICDAGLDPDVVELVSLSTGEQIRAGFDALLLCYRSALLDAIEGRIIRP